MTREMVSKESSHLLSSQTNGKSTLADRLPGAMTVRSVLLNRDSPDIESRLKKRRNRTHQVRFKDLEDGSSSSGNSGTGDNSSHQKSTKDCASPHPLHKHGSRTALPWVDEPHISSLPGQTSVVGAVRGDMASTIEVVAAFLARAPPHPLTPGPTRKCWTPPQANSLTLPTTRKTSTSTAIQTSPCLKKPLATHRRSHSLGDSVAIDGDDEQDSQDENVIHNHMSTHKTKDPNGPSGFSEQAINDRKLKSRTELKSAVSVVKNSRHSCQSSVSHSELCHCCTAPCREGAKRPGSSTPSLVRRRKRFSRTTSDPGKEVHYCTTPTQTDSHSLSPPRSSFKLCTTHVQTEGSSSYSDPKYSTTQSQTERRIQSLPVIDPTLSSLTNLEPAEAPTKSASHHTTTAPPTEPCTTQPQIMNLCASQMLTTPVNTMQIKSLCSKYQDPLPNDTVPYNFTPLEPCIPTHIPSHSADKDVLSVENTCVTPTQPNLSSSSSDSDKLVTPPPVTSDIIIHPENVAILQPSVASLAPLHSVSHVYTPDSDAPVVSQCLVSSDARHAVTALEDIIIGVAPHSVAPVVPPVTPNPSMSVDQSLFVAPVVSTVPVIKSPLVDEVVTSPCVDLVVTLSSVSPVFTLSSVSSVVSSPSVAPVVTLPSVVTLSSVAPVITSPSVAPVITSPPVAPVITSPPVAPVITSPSVAPVITSPSVAPVATLSSVVSVVTSPPVAPIITSPSVSPVITLPSIAPVITSPPVLTSPSVAPVITPVITSPSVAPVATLSSIASVITSPSVAPVVTLSPVTPYATSPSVAPVLTMPSADLVVTSPSAGPVVTSDLTSQSVTPFVTSPSEAPVLTLPSADLVVTSHSIAPVVTSCSLAPVFSSHSIMPIGTPQSATRVIAPQSQTAVLTPHPIPTCSVVSQSATPGTAVILPVFSCSTSLSVIQDCSPVSNIYPSPALTCSTPVPRNTPVMPSTMSDIARRAPTPVNLIPLLPNVTSPTNVAPCTFVTQTAISCTSISYYTTTHPVGPSGPQSHMFPPAYATLVQTVSHCNIPCQVLQNTVNTKITPFSSPVPKLKSCTSQPILVKTYTSNLPIVQHCVTPTKKAPLYSSTFRAAPPYTPPSQTQDKRGVRLPPPPPPPPPYTPRKNTNDQPTTQTPMLRTDNKASEKDKDGSKNKKEGVKSKDSPKLSGRASSLKHRAQTPPVALMKERGSPAKVCLKSTCLSSAQAQLGVLHKMLCSGARPRPNTPCQFPLPQTQPGRSRMRRCSVPADCVTAGPLTPAQADTLRQVQEILGGLMSGTKCKLDPSKVTEKLLSPNGPLRDIRSLQTQLQSLEGVLETSQNTIKVLLDVIQDLEKKEAVRDGHLYRTGQDIENCGTCRDCACIIYSVEHDFRLQEGQVVRTWKVGDPPEARPQTPTPPPSTPLQQDSPQAERPPVSAKKNRKKCFWFL